VVVATDEELEAAGSSPCAGPLTAECEAQALATLRAAVRALLEPVEERLRELEAGLHRGGEEGGGAAAAGGGQEEGLNENGLDAAGWGASLAFCGVYLRGQRGILERALQECDWLEGEPGAGEKS
jgi:hypothetical protein